MYLVDDFVIVLLSLNIFNNSMKFPRFPDVAIPDMDSSWPLNGSPCFDKYKVAFNNK